VLTRQRCRRDGNGPLRPRENLKLYRKLLAETTDEQQRRTLLKLLADEEAKDVQPPEQKPS
jgi:hypothetical protein